MMVEQEDRARDERRKQSSMDNECVAVAHTPEEAAAAKLARQMKEGVESPESKLWREMFRHTYNCGKTIEQSAKKAGEALSAYREAMK
jgi:hypothetical protein